MTFHTTTRAKAATLRSCTIRSQVIVFSIAITNSIPSALRVSDDVVQYYSVKLGALIPMSKF